MPEKPMSEVERVHAALDRAREQVRPLVERMREGEQITAETMNLRFCPPGHCPEPTRRSPMTIHEELLRRVMEYVGAEAPAHAPGKVLALKQALDAARSELAGLRAAIREGALMANVVTGDGADAMPVRIASSLAALWQRATEERDALRSEVRALRRSRARLRKALGEYTTYTPASDLWYAERAKKALRADTMALKKGR